MWGIIPIIIPKDDRVSQYSMRRSKKPVQTTGLPCLPLPPQKNFRQIQNLFKKLRTKIISLAVNNFLILNLTVCGFLKGEPRNAATTSLIRPS